jgi:5'(3')-deoxyribonucleotidase
MQILIDMDGVLCDYNGTLVASGLVRAEELTAERWWQTDLEEDRLRQLDDLVHQPGFFQEMAPMPGSLEALDQLLDDAHDLWIVSQAPGFPQAFAEKYAWILEHCPRMRDNVVLCRSKELVTGDVLIDDSLSILTSWSHGRRVLLHTNPGMPLPELPEGICAAANWPDVLEFIATLKASENKKKSR